MKKKLLVGIITIIIIVLVIVSFIIPIREEERWVNDDSVADVGHYETFHYNLYGIRIK